MEKSTTESRIAAMLPDPPDKFGAELARSAVLRMLIRCRNETPVVVEWLHDGHPSMPPDEAGCVRFCAKATYPDGKELFTPYEVNTG